MPDITRFRLPRFQWEQIDDERWATRNTPESGGWSLEAAKHGRGYYAAVNGGFTEVSLAYEIRWSVFRDTLEGAKRAAEEYVESRCRACMVEDERATEEARAWEMGESARDQFLAYLEGLGFTREEAKMRADLPAFGMARDQGEEDRERFAREGRA